MPAIAAQQGLATWLRPGGGWWGPWGARLSKPAGRASSRPALARTAWPGGRGGTCRAAPPPYTLGGIRSCSNHSPVSSSESGSGWTARKCRPLQGGKGGRAVGEEVVGGGVEKRSAAAARRRRKGRDHKALMPAEPVSISDSGGCHFPRRAATATTAAAAGAVAGQRRRFNYHRGCGRCMHACMHAQAFRAQHTHRVPSLASSQPCASSMLSLLGRQPP
jgi:hypothetical protein